MSITTQRYKPRTDLPVVLVSLGLLSAFVVATLVVPETVGTWVQKAFSYSVDVFGAFWQVLLLATFVVAVVLGVSPYGRVRLGQLAQPEFSRFKWIAMIMCTLLAAGGVFWAAAGPMYHFISPPPYFGDIEKGSAAAARIAMAQSFVHWGFLAWAILGSLGAVVLLYAQTRGMPLRPRSLLYPVLGERACHSPIGAATDVVCIVAVVAGTVGPIGFLGLQVSYGLNALFGVPNSYTTQTAVIVALTGIAVVSVLTGLHRGIQFMSRANVWMTLALMAVVFVVGAPLMVIDLLLGGFGTYINEFVPLSLYRGSPEWLGSWTVFFFGWFLGYGPLMSVFVARISHGRTLRDLVGGTTVLPPIATAIWFSVLGGTGIALEQQNPVSVSGPLQQTGLPAAAISIARQLPAGTLLAVVLLILTVTFVATTTDSMSYTIAAAGTKTNEPRRLVRALSGMVMGTAAIALISIGEGGISALQSFIVVTAVPVGFVMLPTLWGAPRAARELAREQGVVRPAGTPTARERQAESNRADPEPEGDSPTPAQSKQTAPVR